VLDDHSPASSGHPGRPAATGELAWDAFELAANRYGLSRQALFDNSLFINRRPHRVEVALATSLVDLELEMIISVL